MPNETIEKLKNPLRRLRLKTWIMLEKWGGVDLSAQSTVEAVGLSRERSEGYMATTRRLKRVLKQLHICETDCIVDLGCGKGKAMYYMTSFPFHKIYGVELSEEIAEIAKTNIARLHMDRCEIINTDAGKYAIPDEVNYLYMFNPFPEVVVDEVMQNIADSLARKKRKFTIIYLNPLCHDIIVKSGTFHQVSYWKYFSIYTN